MQWTIDPTHSEIGFGVRHLGISTVRGRFQKFEGTVETTEAGAPIALSVTVDAASIDTNVSDRDNHLRSADFLDVTKYPTIGYRSTKIAEDDRGEYDITGDLTIHGVTRSVSFRAEVEAPVKDPWGNRRVAGVASGKLNRKDFGLHWNQLLEAGGLLVGEEVKFHFEVELIEVAVPVVAGV